MKKLIILLFLVIAIPLVVAEGYYVGKTTATYNGTVTSGSLSGYAAANSICNAEYTSSHICTVEEILYSIKALNTSNYTGTGWIVGGTPGYLASANDCRGLRYSTNTYLGRFWDWDESPTTGSVGWLTNCAQLKPLFCCKGESTAAVGAPGGGGGGIFSKPSTSVTTQNVTCDNLVNDINKFRTSIGETIFPSNPFLGFIIFLIVFLIICFYKELSLIPKYFGVKK